MRQKEMTETHYHISKPTACFMLDLKMYEDKIRTKEEQKAKEKQDKKRRRNEIRTFLLRFLHAFLPGNHILRLE